MHPADEVKSISPADDDDDDEEEPLSQMLVFILAVNPIHVPTKKRQYTGPQEKHSPPSIFQCFADMEQVTGHRTFLSTFPCKRDCQAFAKPTLFCKLGFVFVRFTSHHRDKS